MAKKKKKVKKKNIKKGIAHIQATLNNTIITVTNLTGKTILWASAGSSGFKGSRKSTPFAAQTAAEKIGTLAIEKGLLHLDLRIKGPGPGREPAIRALKGIGVNILSIQDITPIPHNGCRPRKQRRI